MRWRNKLWQYVWWISERNKDGHTWGELVLSRERVVREITEMG